MAGLLVGVLLAPFGKEYAASARLVLDTPDPVARQQSQAYSDTAKAIATAPAQVDAALRAAGADRGDPADYAKSHVSVSALGSSGVIELVVTDRNAAVAAAVANALADQLIETRLKVAQGQIDRIFSNIDERTTELNKKIAAATDYVNTLGTRINSSSSAVAYQLRTKRAAAQASLSFLTEQRNSLETQRVSLLSASAERPRPTVISAASRPSHAESSHPLAYIVLGALLGLIAGLGAVGFLETIRPTLVGGDMLADELDAALLGTIDRAPAVAAAPDLKARIRLAAEAAEVGKVSLISAGPKFDLRSLARSLNGFSPPRSKHNGFDAEHPLTIGPYTAHTPPVNNGIRHGFVLVSPESLKKSELNDIASLLKVSRLPLLGVITYSAPESGLQRSLKDTWSRIREVQSR